MSDDAHDPERPRSRGQVQADVDEELRFHLDMRREQLESKGFDPAAAHAEVLRRFGDLEATRRACVETDRGRERVAQRRRYWEEVVQDAGHGLRQLRSRPLFALAAIVTLAIGIGATTSIFGAADHVLFRPLPYRDIDRAVTLWEKERGGAEGRKQVSPGNFLDWMQRTSSFQTMGLAEPTGYDLTGDGPPEPIAAWDVSRGYFEALGVTPLLGRWFSDADHRPGGTPVVVISHGLWQRRYASDPSIVGKDIRLDGRPVTIIGVLPRDADYPEPKDLWAPKIFREHEPTDRRSSYMHAVARLKPGVSLAAARADLARVSSQLAAEHPRTNATLGVELVPLEEQVLGSVRPAMLVLLGAVTLMLLIACANIVGLLLARGAERESELAVRAALGADRGRLLRQMLTESLLLAVLGGTAGLLLAWWGTQTLVALSPPWLPRADTMAIDGRVLGFALVVTLGSSLLFGLLPALRFARVDLQPSLGSGGRIASSRARVRLRSGLVVTEIALALVLLAGAGLLIRSFWELTSNDVGFSSERRLSLQLFLWDRNSTPEKRLQRMDEIATRFRSVPGVQEVGLVSALPFHPSQIDARDALAIEGRPAPATEADAQVYTTVASPEYFHVMGIPLRRGRVFEASDRMNAPRVALINESLARLYFAGEDPIGKRVTIGVMSAAEPREIVGVVGDVRPTSLDSEPRPELYAPFGQSASGSVTFVVRTRGEPGAMVALMRKKVWEIDPDQTIYHAATVQEMISDTLVERRFHLLLLGVFSFIAMVLAGIGVYGLIAMTTSQRTHEIGVRIALGARPRDIVGMIVAQGIRLVVPGVLIGVAGALFLTRFLGGMLYQVRPTDPVTFAQVAMVMMLIAIVAALVPAVRAAITDPVRALRQD